MDFRYFGRTSSGVHLGSSVWAGLDANRSGIRVAHVCVESFGTRYAKDNPCNGSVGAESTKSAVDEELVHLHLGVAPLGFPSAHLIWGDGVVRTD